jgi:hypothetical protein
MALKPPLDLYIEVDTIGGGRYRWDAQQAPGSRLQSFTFATKTGDGFSEASGQLSRRIDQDYPDLQLANGIRVVGTDGSVAYEGRVQALPRDLGDAHSISVTTAGWMANASDRPGSEIYVDRNLSSWGPPTVARNSALYQQNRVPTDPSTITGGGAAAVSTTFGDSWVAPYTPISEAWYDAGSANNVGRVAYGWARVVGLNPSVDPNWFWAVFSSPDEVASTASSTGNLAGAGPIGLQEFIASAGARYALLQLSYVSSPAGQQGAAYSLNWQNLAVYGTHTLNLYQGAVGEPRGVFASDVIRDAIARWCPMLNANGVVQSNYVIPHLVYRDPTMPFDMFTDVNKYHLWHLGCWEDRTVHFRPYDMGDWDWEVRTDGDSPAGFSGQGDSTSDLRNGIIIQYPDVFTGNTETVRPETHPELRDTNPNNPWNRAGYLVTGPAVTISVPTTQAGALQFGRLLLDDSNRPKAPGQITVTGHVRDRVGTWQQAWKVRAGDRVAITSLPFDGPRLVTETSYDNESKTLTMTLEHGASGVEALLDRITTGLAANNLGL